MRDGKGKLGIAAVLFSISWLLFLFIAKLESTSYFLGVDLRIENLAIFFRYQSAVNFFRVITFLGNWQLIFPLTVIICLALWKYKKFKYLFPLLLATGGGQLCSSTLKAVFGKERPLLSLVTESSFAFPSGHAVISTAFYGLLIYFIFINLKNNFLRFLTVFLGIILIFSIGFSRIYLAAHFYSDVLGGFILGFVWLLIGVLLYKNFSLKISRLIISLVSIIVLLISALFFSTLSHLIIPAPLKTVVTNNVLNSFKAENLPKFTEKLSGAYQQPLSFFVLAKDDNELINIFNKEGWVLTERLNLVSAIKLAETGIDNKPYPSGPITPSLWDKQAQTLSFAKPTTENTIRIRHHCRFWKTNIKTTDGQTLYVGTASFDLSLKRWLITHKIDPNIDKEREFLFNDLLKTGNVKASEKINSVGPINGKNFQGDYFYTDGKAYLIYFK
jgi:membrane-associated phospholipid phosphatase